MENEKVNSTHPNSDGSNSNSSNDAIQIRRERRREEEKKDAVKLHKCFKFRSWITASPFICSCRWFCHHVVHEHRFNSRDCFRQHTILFFFGPYTFVSPVCAQFLSISLSLFVVFSAIRLFSSSSFYSYFSLLQSFATLVVRHWRKLNMNNSWCTLHVGYNSNIKRERLHTKTSYFLFVPSDQWYASGTECKKKKLKTKRKTPESRVKNSLRCPLCHSSIRIHNANIINKSYGNHNPPNANSTTTTTKLKHKKVCSIVKHERRWYSSD